MKVVIDEESCNKMQLSISEVLMILLVQTGVDIPELIKSMKQKQILVEEPTLVGLKFFITQRWKEQCDRALLLADKSIPDNSKLEELAKKLMEVFPAGKKEGTSQYWKGNIRDNTLRLGKFFKLYGNKYTDEEIIAAAKRYVSSFNGSYQFMRVLKYFIWKEEKKVNSSGEGHIEEVSDLASFIDNANEESLMREDWTSSMV